MKSILLIFIDEIHGMLLSAYHTTQAATPKATTLNDLFPREDLFRIMCKSIDFFVCILPS